MGKLNVEVAIGLCFNKIGFVVSGETVNIEVKILLCCVFRIYEQKNGQKAELDEKSQFQLALHGELWGTAYIQGLYTDGKQLG